MNQYTYNGVTEEWTVHLTHLMSTLNGSQDISSNEYQKDDGREEKRRMNERTNEHQTPFLELFRISGYRCLSSFSVSEGLEELEAE